VTDKILFTLQVFPVFFAVLDKRTELSSSFIEASSEIGRRMKSLQAKQRTCKDYIIGRKITTVPTKDNVDS